MAHKLTKGLKSLFISGSYSPRVRQSAPITTEPYARRTLDHTERDWRRQSCCSSPFHVRRPGLEGIANVVRSPRGSIDSVPATSSPRSCQWQGSRGSLHPLTFSSTVNLTPRSFQWEGAQDLDEDLPPGSLVGGLAGTSLLRHSRRKSQEFVQLPLIIPSTPATTPPLADGPHRRRRSAGAMPRCGYDTTNMHVAVNPRPAATAVSSGHSRSDKPRSDTNNGGGSSSGRDGDSGRGEGNGGHDDDNGSEKIPEQGPGRGSKDGGPNTEEHKTIDDVRLPLAGRGWTFWL